MLSWYVVAKYKVLNKINKFRTHSPSTLRHDFNRLRSALSDVPLRPHRSWCPLMFAPHCLSTKRQADIVASLGTHMNSGNPIEVVPLRATTGLCGGAVHSATVPLSRFVARKQFATTKLFALDFGLCTFPLFLFSRFPDLTFWIFQSFALYNAMGPHCLWPGMTPVSGRRPPAGVASIVLPDEAARLEGTPLLSG